MTLLDYESPEPRGARLWSIALFVGLAFTVGHLVIDLAVWVVLFYGFGFFQTTTSSLFDLERFVFSYIAEIVLAVIGGLTVFALLGVNQFSPRSLRVVPLTFLAFGLGATMDGLLWLMPDQRVALTFTLLLPLTVAFVLCKAARYQEQCRRIVTA